MPEIPEVPPAIGKNDRYLVSFNTLVGKFFILNIYGYMPGKRFVSWAVSSKLVRNILPSNNLHPKNRKDVDEDRKDECEVPEGSKCWEDNVKENFHREPALGKFEYPQLNEEVAVSKK